MDSAKKIVIYLLVIMLGFLLLDQDSLGFEESEYKWESPNKQFYVKLAGCWTLRSMRPTTPGNSSDYKDGYVILYNAAGDLLNKQFVRGVNFTEVRITNDRVSTTNESKIDWDLRSFEHVFFDKLNLDLVNESYSTQEQIYNDLLGGQVFEYHRLKVFQNIYKGRNNSVVKLILLLQSKEKSNIKFKNEKIPYAILAEYCLKGIIGGYPRGAYFNGFVISNQKEVYNGWNKWWNENKSIEPSSWSDLVYNGE